MSSRSFRAFTLVEMLVVIALIAMLVALLLPAVSAARESMRRAQCAANLRQVGLGILNFESAKGYLPCSHVTSPYRYGAWVAILPFIDEAGLFKRYNFSANFCSTANSTVAQAHLKIFNCPSSPAINETFSGFYSTASGDYTGAVVSYTAITSNLTYLGPSWDQMGKAMLNPTTPGPTVAMTTDGLSNSMMVHERAMRHQWWVRGVRQPNPPSDFNAGGNSTLAYTIGYPGTYSEDGYTQFYKQGGVGPCSINCNNQYGLYAFHPRGAHGLFGDGSVHFLKDTLDGYVLWALVSRACDDIVQQHQY